MSFLTDIDGVFRKSILENGLRVVSEATRGTQSISLGAWVLVGSRNESRSNNGISHFIEHLVFKGTKRRSAMAIARSLESVGGNLNAFTGKEATCYIAQILAKDLELAVDVLADLIQNPVFDGDELEKEKNVIHEEIRSLEDTPEELVHEYFQEHLFPHHPLGYSILGTHGSVDKFNRDSVIRYWQQYYTGNRMILSASGSVDHETLVALCEKYFFRNAGKAYPPRKCGGAFKPLQSVIPRHIFQSHICIGAPSVSYKTPAKYPLMILGTILGGGMSSRLFQNIREKHGIAYSIYSFSEFMSDCGFFGVYTSTEKENIPKILKLILREFKKLREKRIPARELSEAKTQLRGNLILGMENPMSRMSRIAKMEMHLREYITLQEVLNSVVSVSAGEIMDIAETLLNEHCLQTTMLVPESD